MSVDTLVQSQENINGTRDGRSGTEENEQKTLIAVKERMKCRFLSASQTTALDLDESGVDMNSARFCQGTPPTGSPRQDTRRVTMVDEYVSDAERTASTDAVSRRPMQAICTREENMVEVFSHGPMVECLLGLFSQIDGTDLERCSFPRSHNSRLKRVHLEKEACLLVYPFLGSLSSR